ncbi:hypothetical protein N431DRAFT_469033 [Stipitochalara longipes BDJ]|nr:hypothetical protein N431DRAFT_469033 [Stipitochalara longipes BDJ]
MSFIVFIFCPNLPHQAQSWFLKSHERERLLQDLEQSHGKESTGVLIDNVLIWRIFLDWCIHLFTMCIFCCDITASSVAGFAPTILKELGWTAAKAQLMKMPIWGVGIVYSFMISVIDSKVNFRTPFIFVAICIQLVGWGILKV